MAPMALYFFHIHDGEKIIRDEEGGEFETAELAAAEARATAHDLAVQYAREGHPFGTHGVEMADDTGFRLSFIPLAFVLN
jgi:hypothetical protein